MGRLLELELELELVRGLELLRRLELALVDERIQSAEPGVLLQRLPRANAAQQETQGRHWDVTF